MHTKTLGFLNFPPYPGAEPRGILLIKDFNGGNIVEARKKQIKSVKIINVLNSYGGTIVAGKRLLKTIGIDCGNFRFPVAKFDENEYENFINDLKNAGFNETESKTSTYKA